MTASCTDSLFDADKFSYTGATTITETNVGNYSEAIDTTKASYDDNNLDVTFVAGTDVTFEITPADISDDERFTVTAPEDVTYNGKKQEQKPVIKDGDKVLKEGTDYTLSYSDDVTNVGEVKVTITGTGNYTGTTTTTYNITTASLTITAKDQEYTYNGEVQGEGDTAYEDPAEIAAKVTVEGLQGEDRLTSIILDGQGDAVGSYEIEVTGAAIANKNTGENVNRNYEITYVAGTLTIVLKQVTVHIKGKHNSVVYDGRKHTVKGYDVVSISDELYSENSITEKTVISAEQKNAGKKMMNLAPESFGNSDKNFDVQFIIDEDGYQEVTPKTITVTTESASKVYDGSPLTASGKISGLVKGETATVVTTGSQTEVGNSKNTFGSIKWGSANKANYKVEVGTIGTLTVTAAPAPTPTPTPTPTPGPGPDGGGNVTPVTPADDGTVIPDEPVPEGEPEPDTIIPDDPTPTVVNWAVLNLVAAILTALGAAIALFRKKEEDDNESDEDDNRSKKMLAAKIAGALAGVAAPITFFLTEDMSGVPTLIDKWTVLMAAMLAVQVVAAVFNKKASELPDEEEGAEEAAN